MLEIDGVFQHKLLVLLLVLLQLRIGSSKKKRVVQHPPSCMLARMCKSAPTSSAPMVGRPDRCASPHPWQTPTCRRKWQKHPHLLRSLVSPPQEGRLERVRLFRFHWLASRQALLESSWNPPRIGFGGCCQSPDQPRFPPGESGAGGILDRLDRFSHTPGSQTRPP